MQGGVEKHCESLYPLFDSRYRFCVFRRKPYVRSSQTYPDIAFIDLPSTRIKGFEAFFHSFLATVCCLFLRPDVVHIHNIGPALFSPLLRLFGLKTVLTYHSPNYEHKKWGFFARHLLKLSERIAFRTAEAIVLNTMSENTEETLEQVFGSVEIPMYVRYMLYSGNKFSLGVTGGLNGGFIVSNKVYLESENGKELLGSTENIRKFNLSTDLSLGVEYPVTRKIKIMLEPGFRYYLQSLSRNERINFKPYTFTLSTGIGIEF